MAFIGGKRFPTIFTGDQFDDGQISPIVSCAECDVNVSTANERGMHNIPSPPPLPFPSLPVTILRALASTADCMTVRESKGLDI